MLSTLASARVAIALVANYHLILWLIEELGSFPLCQYLSVNESDSHSVPRIGPESGPARRTLTRCRVYVFRCEAGKFSLSGTFPEMGIFHSRKDSKIRLSVQ